MNTSRYFRHKGGWEYDPILSCIEVQSTRDIIFHYTDGTYEYKTDANTLTAADCERYAKPDEGDWEEIYPTNLPVIPLRVKKLEDFLEQKISECKEISNTSVYSQPFDRVQIERAEIRLEILQEVLQFMKENNIVV